MLSARRLVLLQSATRSLPSVAAQGGGPSTKSSARESREPSLKVLEWGLRCGTVASTALQLPDTPTERARSEKPARQLR